jgi:hypothetical protein
VESPRCYLGRRKREKGKRDSGATRQDDVSQLRPLSRVAGDYADRYKNTELDASGTMRPHRDSILGYLGGLGATEMIQIAKLSGLEENWKCRWQGTNTNVVTRKGRT